MTPLLRNLVEIIMGSGVLPAGGSQTPGKTPNKRRSSDVLGLEDEAGQTLLEASVWTQAELAATASVLLNLFYELLGALTTEDSVAACISTYRNILEPIALGTGLSSHFGLCEVLLEGSCEMACQHTSALLALQLPAARSTEMMMLDRP